MYSSSAQIRCSFIPHRALTAPLASDHDALTSWGQLVGYSAASIDPAARGVGLLQEGGVPVRLRSCWLDDLDLAELARRAEGLRATTRTTSPTLRLVEDEPA